MNRQAFYGGEGVEQYFQRRRQVAIQEIKGAAPDYLMGVPKEEFLKYLFSKYEEGPLHIDWENADTNISETDVHGHKLPFVNVSVPYSGNATLFTLQPKSCRVDNIQIQLTDTEFHFGWVNHSNNPKQIEIDFARMKESLTLNCNQINVDVKALNEYTRRVFEEVHGQRMAEVDSLRKLMESVSLPVRKKANPPQVYSVPEIRLKAVPQPAKAAQPSAVPVKPQYHLDPPIYDDILQTMYLFGEVIEHNPSVKEKDEEALRDMLLYMLQPRYEGSATGETFNKKGKTDLLIQYQKSNVFVGECKFWHGAKGHIETIGQLLSYLTWKDCQAAIVLFVENADMSGTLATILEATKSHPQHRKYIGEAKKGWLRFEFSLPNDSGVIVKLSILAFHVKS